MPAQYKLEKLNLQGHMISLFEEFGRKRLGANQSDMLAVGSRVTTKES